jgi:prevent-host-death family protein
MPQPQWSLQDAKNRFSAVVEAARNGVPQTVTKHGKPVAVVLSVEEYEKLTGKAAPQRPSFVEHLLAMPKDDEAFDPVNLKLRDVEF